MTGPLVSLNRVTGPQCLRDRAEVAVSCGSRSYGVIHLELDRVRCVFEGVDLFPLELDVSLDLVPAEDVALGKEGVVGAQVLHRLAQGPADGRNVLQLLRR